MAQSKARYLSSLLTASGFVKDDRSQLAGSDGSIDSASLPVISNAMLAHSGITINDYTVSLGDSQDLTTTDIGEGTNLYYTTARVDSDVGQFLSGGTGLTFNNVTGVIEITDTGVTVGTYGSASQVPVFTVNAQGQIDSIGVVNVAGVDSFGYNNTTGEMSIATADGGNFTATVTLNPFNTDNLTEGSNLYYTQNRVDSSFDARLATKTTDNLTEGSTNLYWTTARFDSSLAGASTTDLSEGDNLYYTQARFDSAFGDKTTTDLTEGNNLFYTDARVRSAIGASGDLSYDSSTGVFSLTVENIYNKASFDSDFNVAMDSATTDDLTEGSNLYYTDTRARNAIGLQQNGGDGSLTYDSASGRFTFVGTSAAETRAHFSGGTGITYTSGTGEIKITNTGVTNGTYGSASEVPVITVSATGQIDSIGTVSVAGVTNFVFDSSNGNFTISTADGGSYVTTATLDPFTTTNLVEGTNLYYTTARADSDFDVRLATKSTTDIAEGNNLYYTTARFDSDFGDNTTDDLTEGATNLYYTSARANTDFDTRLATKSTSDLAEGTNLYYTTARADSDAKAAISVTDAGGDGSLTYNSGVITYTGPSASETRAHFSGGTGVTITNGSVAIGQSVGTTDDVTFGKVTGDSAALNNIALTRRTSAPRPDADLVGGELYFDSDPSKGLTFIPRTKEGNTDVAVNIGQEELIYVHNNLGEQINNGEVVRFVGADSDGVPRVEKTLASSPISGPIGMATMDIPDQAHGYITTLGIVRGIDTIRSGLGGPFAVGDRAYICNVNAGGWVKHDIGPDSGYPYELGTVLVADSNDGAILINPVREHWTRARFSGKVKTSGDLQADGDVTARSIKFDGSVPDYTEGELYYDSANGAIAFRNDVQGITMQIGQEDWIRVYNDTGSTISNGKPVYISGSNNNFPTIALANATAETTVHAIGLATHDIANGSYGYVTTKGVVNDVDTSAFSAGDKVHVGLTDGAIQAAAPTYPNFAVDLGYVLTADSAGAGGSILVSIVDHVFEVVRTTGDARFDTDVEIGGNLTVLGTQTVAATENISIGGAFQYFNAGDTIGDANTAFTGSGLDDATLKGHYTGTATNQKFYVKIDGTGGTDTFEWGYADSDSPEATGVAITGGEQTLNYGISVEFVATTGHTSGDTWKGSASPVNVDTGWFSNRNTGTSGVGYTHVGMFFDVSEQKFTLVEEYDPEPEGTINLDSATLGTLKLGTLEGNVTGDVTGNADTATLLETGRTIGISGDITAAGVSFNGGSNITLSASIDSAVVSNVHIASNAAIADTKLATISTAGKVNNSATTATNANTASAIVARDASGNFSAGTITATLSGNVTGNVTGTVSDISNHTTDDLTQGSTNLYYDSATTQTNARNAISVSGDLSYNAATGVISYTDSDRTAAQIKGLFSASGSLSYNSSTGEFSYTDSDRTASQIRGLFSAGGNLSYNSGTGEFSYTDSDRTPAQIKGLFSAGTNTTYSDGSFSISDATIRGKFSAGGDLSYNSGTGEFSFTETYSTANELLTAIKTVDGATSGLDADLLDGQHGSYYRINVYDASGTLQN